MSFNAKQITIDEILTKVHYNIPRNQRRYVWGKNNWEELHNDIVLVTKNKEISHFLGSIVLQERDKINNISQYTIIDGQQRITTIVIIVAVLLKLFHENDDINSYSGLTDFIRSKDIKSNLINIVSSEYHQSIEMLIDAVCELNESDKSSSISSFLKQITCIDKKDDIIRNCFLYYYEELNKLVCATSEGICTKNLQSFRSALLNTNIVRIVSSSEEDSYTIFEILNARGQSLDDYELVKNFIMRYYYPKDDIDKVKESWHNIERRLGSSFNKFIKHYTDHRFRSSKSTVKETDYITIKKNTESSKVLSLLNDINTKSIYYKKIITPNLDESSNGYCDEIEYKVFSFLKSYNQSLFRPLFLSLIHQKDIEKLDIILYHKTLLSLYHFFICYTIIGEEKSNKLENLILKYSNKIEISFSVPLVEGLLEDLQKKAPDFSTFSSAFCNIGYSNHKNFHNDSKHKKKVQLILRLIEEYHSKIPVNNSDFTIEHLHNDCKGSDSYKIGNLVPLEGKLNTHKDKTLSEKMSNYNKSGYSTTKIFYDRYNGKVESFDIIKRSKELSKLVYNEILGYKIDN